MKSAMHETNRTHHSHQQPELHLHKAARRRCKDNQSMFTITYLLTNGHGAAYGDPVSLFELVTRTANPDLQRVRVMCE
jgi:hypothetical protein